MSERVQKLMSRAGFGSRRVSEKFIADGRVTINGKVAHLGDRADPQTDVIEVDGARLSLESRIYIKLNKPKGVISSTEDELARGRSTVRDLVKLPGFMYPVGRLDKQSEGLMLITNDGQLAHHLTHPRFRHRKVYEVAVEGEMSDKSLALWRRGLILDGRMTAPAEIDVRERDSDITRFTITLREGRKRQIRRIAASLGHPVTKLLRTQIGPLRLGKLRTGEWAYLSKGEIASLRKAVSLSDHI